MAALFSKPKAPYIPPVDTSAEDAAAEEAAKAEADRLRKRKGMRSTILTGAQGVTSPASVHKTLLG